MFNLADCVSYRNNLVECLVAFVVFLSQCLSKVNLRIYGLEDITYGTYLLCRLKHSIMCIFFPNWNCMQDQQMDRSQSVRIP